jgi:hypothetical protein
MGKKKINYETWRVHYDITSKIKFENLQSEEEIQSIVLNRLGLSSVENDLVSNYVKTFLSSVDYNLICELINDEVKENLNK